MIQLTIKIICTFEYILYKDYRNQDEWYSLKMESIGNYKKEQCDGVEYRTYTTFAEYFNETSVSSKESGGRKTNYSVYERFNNIKLQ